MAACSLTLKDWQIKQMTQLLPQVGNMLAAQEALAGAEAQINSAAESRDSDNAVIMQMLDQANNEFASGNYTEARNSAQDAVTALDAKPAQPDIPIPLIIGAIGVASGCRRDQHHSIVAQEEEETLKVSDTNSEGR